MEFVADIEEYAAKRKPQAQRLEDSLVRSVKVALHRHGTIKAWADALVRRAEKEVRAVYREESGKISARGAALDSELETFRSSLERMLEVTEPDEDRLDEQARTIAASIAALVLSTGTIAAALDSGVDELVKTWVDMDDESVRTAHRNVSQVPLGEKFEVAGVKMDRPGDMRAPIELWINCRCIVAVQSLNAGKIAASLQEGIEMTHVMDHLVERIQEGSTPPSVVAEKLDLAAEIRDAEVVDLAADNEDLRVPWYGVLAPEGVMSGDKRKFSEGSLTWRDLPLPLSWQKVNAEGHDGSVVIGTIDEIWRDEQSQIWGSGFLLDTPEADEYVGMRAQGAVRGVSVDVDAATMQLEDAEGAVVEAHEDWDGSTIMNVTAGRICGATTCAIPAFMEANVMLGLRETEDEQALVASAACLPCQYAAGVDEGSWDGSASGYTDQEWFDATIVHLGEGDERLVKANNKLPIYTPGGKLSRAGVHAAAGRIGQTEAPPAKISAAKASLRGAYDVLGEDPPDSLKAAIADVLEFGEFGEFVKTEDGPGWLTHPVDTNRLRTYWTKGKGALKIRWGVPGDFNRCRQHLAKYIKPQYLNGYCANRHYDALGFWPGRPVAGDTKDFSGPSMHLVASGFDVKPPKEWFEDPHLAEASPLVVTDEGRVFGHLAEWSRCHIGFGQDNCVLAPESASNYAFFNTEYVLTDEGPVTVGHITYNTGHAGGRLSAAAATAHYDNTGTVIADVHAGRDQFGVWLAGWMRPGTGEEEKYILRASAVSGDWRGAGTDMELVAALAVNVAGFPIPRTELVASGGRQVSLVAAGIVPPDVPEEKDPDIFDIEKFADAVAVKLRGIDDRRAKMSVLRASTGRDPKSKMAALAAGRG